VEEKERGKEYSTSATTTARVRGTLVREGKITRAAYATWVARRRATHISSSSLECGVQLVREGKAVAKSYRPQASIADVDVDNDSPVIVLYLAIVNHNVVAN
jgi:hypothetical protein